MDPVVSIIIPSYNYGFVISETLKNIQDQSFQNWEAIIVDDGSADNTREVVEPFTRTDKRIRYIQEKNQGVSVARNRGFKESKGRYIQFLDADDLLSREKLTIQVAYLEQHPDVDISYSNHVYFETSKPHIEYPDYEMNHHNWLPKIDARGYEVVNTLIYSNIAVVSSPLSRREIVQKVNGFPEHSNHTEDWEFWFLCAVHGARYCYLDHDSAKTMIRIHQRNTSRNIQVMQAGELQFRKRIIGSISASSFLTQEEKEKLLARNDASTTKLYKYMMYHANLLSMSQLKRMYPLTNVKTFISYYFKAINYKRKALFKKGR